MSSLSNGRDHFQFLGWLVFFFIFILFLIVHVSKQCRPRFLRRLIWFYTVCQGHENGTLDIHIWAATWQNQQYGCAPSEDSDQPGQPPSLTRVFAVRMRTAWVLSYPLSAQRRLWWDWANAQTDLSLRWAHSHIVGFVMRRLIYGLIWIHQLCPGVLFYPCKLNKFIWHLRGVWFTLISTIFSRDPYFKTVFSLIINLSLQAVICVLTNVRIPLHHILGQKGSYTWNCFCCHANCRRETRFTYLETASICLSNWETCFGLLRLNMLQGWLEYSCGMCFVFAEQHH